MHKHAADFMKLFAGHESAHGKSEMTGKVSASGKIETKNATLRFPVTLEKWHSHLMGVFCLGIIPINEESMCRFGAIDIDDYGTLAPEALNSQIQKLKMPLIMTRTKSGGLHLWIFMKDWAPAALVQEKLLEMAGALGYGHSEIFPKQTKVLSARGDLGSWINIPYLGGDNTERWAYSPDHAVKMDVAKFIETIGNKAIAEEDLIKLTFEIPELLPGGPPCLNRLGKDGFPQGTRNNGLLNLGIYAKKADPDNWKTLLTELNQKLMDPPLSPQEVIGAIKSLERKEYSYTCKAQPIQQFCNAAACKLCKHGIGVTDLGMPKLGTLTKVNCEPPIWFIEVEGGARLEMRTEDLQNPFLFQKKCMAVLNAMPQITTRVAWTEMIQKLLEKVTVIEVPEEGTPCGMLKYYVEEFCTSRVMGKTPEELLLGKPFRHDGRIYFRIIDLLKFLERNKFNALDTNEVLYRLQGMGIKKHFFNVRNKGIRCLEIIDNFDRSEEGLKTPEQDRKTPFA